MSEDKIPIPFSRDIDPDEFTDKLIEFLNVQRAERGLPPVIEDRPGRTLAK